MSPEETANGWRVQVFQTHHKPYRWFAMVEDAGRNVIGRSGDFAFVETEAEAIELALQAARAGAEGGERRG